MVRRFLGQSTQFIIITIAYQAEIFANPIVNLQQGIDPYMLGKIIKTVVGTRNQRWLRTQNTTISSINALEDSYRKLSDAALSNKTIEFRARLGQGETLDDLLPEAFATVREAASRTLKMRHFDVQLLGGFALHSGRIAEMITGEGKTLVATLPAYLNALSGRGVHIVTVNDYLAQRDSEWMGQLYSFLGLTVGVVISGQDTQTKKQAYASNITYGTNNEFGFDYLRDNMVYSADEKAQRELSFAILDEVDSILIDEARTPLIISGATDEHTQMYEQLNSIVPQLQKQADEESEGDYYIDEKGKQIYLSDAGHEHLENLLAQSRFLNEGESLYDGANLILMHHALAALRAHQLFSRNVDYIVRQGQIVIVDEFTGRMMPGRRWGDGLHQAIEAKEHVSIQSENQTLASITFQNYFRQYDKLSGMTGTADTEAYEFQHIYDLEVVVIPANRPMIRQDMPDRIYMNTQSKFDAVISDIEACRSKGQPVLVGTTSIEISEQLSRMLTQKGLSHNVLNAKNHEKEADIIAEAGMAGHVTIATNMAGRGTDIVLGGAIPTNELVEESSEHAQAMRQWETRHQQVLESGGLRIIGTERHESRRVDNQLRGRAGRQGDPGSSQFYLCLEDNLLRIFGSGKLTGMMNRLGMEEDEVIENRWVSRAIENAQRKVEAHNFDIRKQLLEYDDVANDQRQVIYQQRRLFLESETVFPIIQQILHDMGELTAIEYIPPGSIEEQWDLAGLQQELGNIYHIQLPINDWKLSEADLLAEDITAMVAEALISSYQSRRESWGEEYSAYLEKILLLRSLDNLWRDHLAALEYLRQGIHLRGYGQKNPKQEYRREAFIMFEQLLERIKAITAETLFNTRVGASEETMEQESIRPTVNLQFQHPSTQSLTSLPTPAQALPETESGQIESKPVQTFVRDERKVGRNEPCPCGSGKKYKHCHGRLD